MHTLEAARKYEKEYEEGKLWCTEQQMKDCFIRSRDGLYLHAYYLPTKEAKRFVLLSHGYKGSGFGDFSLYETVETISFFSVVFSLCNEQAYQRKTNQMQQTDQMHRLLFPVILIFSAYSLYHS